MTKTSKYASGYKNYFYELKKKKKPMSKKS